MNPTGIDRDYIRQTLKASINNLKQIFGKQESVYTYYQNLDVLFVAMPKVANSSINYLLIERAGLLPEDTSHYKSIHVVKNRLRISRHMLRKLPATTFRFAFVRNPFDRIASLYVNKILHEDHAITRKFFGLIHPGISFSAFAKAIACIPDRLADAHFKSQYSWLYDRGQCLVDFVGHYETLADDFRPIQKRYHLGDLPSLNTAMKTELDELYDRRSAELVYRRYRKDITTFGYENSCQAFINTRQA